MKKAFLILSFVSLSFVGCATTSQKAVIVEKKIDDKISQGVYAVNDSMNVGRFDLAKKYSDQTIRLVPPPKDRVKVLPFYAK